MTVIVGIDPGPETSGLVTVALSPFGSVTVVYASPKVQNLAVMEEIHFQMRPDEGATIAIETPSAIYGGVVGASTIDTILWAGRFLGAAGPLGVRISPQAVRMAVCGTAKAKDAGVRQALIDRFGPVGTKRQKGPLHGVKSHAWRALAVAVAAYDGRGCRPALVNEKVQP